MFGRRKDREGEDMKPSGDTSSTGGERASADAARPSPLAPSRPATPAGGLPDLGRRPAGDLAAPGALRRPDAPTTTAARKADPESKKLIVGRDICLNGEITACDMLIVEGRVEATLSNSHSIEISETGVFKGTAEIDDAEISGRFEGALTVRHRLFLRSTGRIVGTLRYGQIEIECGGEISGDVQVMPPPPAPPAPAPTTAAEPAASSAG
jgi:cytoskeletal protein CcmA (bactofilin family)